MFCGQFDCIHNDESGHKCPYYDEHFVCYYDDPAVDQDEPCPEYMTLEDAQDAKVEFSGEI